MDRLISGDPGHDRVNRPPPNFWGVGPPGQRTQNSGRARRGSSSRGALGPARPVGPVRTKLLPYPLSGERTASLERGGEELMAPARRAFEPARREVPTTSWWRRAQRRRRGDADAAGRREPSD